MGTHRAQRFLVGREERRTGPGDTFTCTRCQCTIGMRPSWRYSFVPMNRESGPDDRQSYPGPPPTAPWIGQRSWLGRDDALMKGGKNSRPPWTMVSVKRIYFFGEWWWKRFGIVDLLDRWRDLGDLDHFWSGFGIGLNVYRINCSWKVIIEF